ncbi:putative di- and tripeptidase DUG2 [Neolecta irregularis DAH-3]|uniref:Putative di-and tripeptidase DUG2 n=1 Tax=Neolecta irregularis (strain DAH-3) TaxID=1198029 RepID=A0A1U7LNY9_NEOID|nr:putative di- and tripeptidase DUG2 [Neolecta irregularis DAH-3]|eukprot:OLL24367.1 putative di- and tripeptidase DUG2 [Neolecta irregularis DAH-3]
MSLDLLSANIKKPSLLHKIRHSGSVLCLAVSQYYIFAGTEDEMISVWDVDNFDQKPTLTGHDGSIMCLSICEEENLLFSSAADATVRVWDSRKLEQLYVLYSTYDVGDIFSVVYSPGLRTIYMGAQNTSIQWYNLHSAKPRRFSQAEHFPTTRYDKFCQVSQTKVSVAPEYARVKDKSEYLNDKFLEIPPANSIQYAHYGYVYTLLLAHVLGEQRLLSGGGDGQIRIWTINRSGMKNLKTLHTGDFGIVSLIVLGAFLYSGLLGGQILIWDLETFQLVRQVRAYDGYDVLSLSNWNECIFSAAANGVIKQWDNSFRNVHSWKAHDGLVLSSQIIVRQTKQIMVTGGNDHMVSIWNMSCIADGSFRDREPYSNDLLISTLSRFVSFKTVSGCSANLEECRRGSTFLKHLLKDLGATNATFLLTDNSNPVVLGQFKTIHGPKRKHILFYGHYDVISAEESWSPWEVSGQDGYLYGRGVSDNKGPCLAAIYAVAELVQHGKLNVDVSFLIEGEEEKGSTGFFDTVSANKDLIGEVDWIFLSNSYWFDDSTPCLTYGLRGVIHATVKVYNNLADAHSGMEGGAYREPMIDLIHLMSSLTNEYGGIKLPGFYGPVRKVTAEEKELYAAITSNLSCSARANDIKTLMARWRHPSLTIHRMKVSGSGNRTIIPHECEAAISIRIVPNQVLEEIIATLESYLHSEFLKLKSDNTMEINVNHKADWWLGDPTNHAFKLFESAICEEWEIDKPLYIREGGSIPVVRWLEKEFNAAAVQFPMGQSSDQAHLRNERLRIVNLQKGKEILKKVFERFGTELF